MVPASCREVAESLLRKYPVMIGESFITIDDIYTANELIGRLELMHEMVKDIDFKGASFEGTNIAAEGLDLENIILTAIALNVVSGKNTFRPLSQDEFVVFINAATGIKEKKRHVKQVFIKELKKLVSGMVPESGLQAIGGTVDQLCKRLDLELMGFKSVKEINPQYITCLIVKL